MTRWLEAARAARSRNDKTDKTDETCLESASASAFPREKEVLSVKSVLSREGVPESCASHVIDKDRRDDFEERAAILEFDAGLSQEEAEVQARQEIYGSTAWAAGAMLWKVDKGPATRVPWPSR